jgi:predicted ATPase
VKIKYRINNFKAFSDSGEMSFSPVTVLCGANSTGKSSIIKSILLAKQSTAERRSSLKIDAPSQPLILNGELTKLGAWSDTITGKDRAKSMGFCWSVKLSQEEFDDALKRAGLLRRGEASSELDLANQRDLTLSVSLSSDTEVREELSARVDRWDVNLDDLNVRVFRQEVANGSRPLYRVEINSIRKLIRRKGSKFGSYRVILGDLHKALSGADTPISLGNVYAVNSGPFIGRIEPRFDETWTNFFEAIYKLSVSHRGRKRGPAPGWLEDLGAAVRTYRKGLSEGKMPTARNTAMRVLTYLAIEFVSEISLVFSETKAVLAPMWQDIRYLGPLRDQPRRYYQFDDTGGADVGVSGEFTVQVLALEQGRVLQSTRLASLPSNRIKFTDRKLTTLLDHTNFWLSWMGLPAVSPLNLQQSLYGLAVGDLRVGLLDVGFGVSQVLPIIVETLRAEKGDLVILEQPEIHLHPRVQALLGDFLLARSQDGVRFLVESHSEYLIKRLCRRVSESESENLRPSIEILFIEGSPEGASCRPVELNDYGEILNWPKGFFDLDEDLHWTHAALERRRASNAKKQK